jgi:large subunit ribosomal protein L25
MATNATRLQVTPREPAGSRANRRLRRQGRVPGILYGHGVEPVAFDVDARTLRLALAARGAVLEVDLGGRLEPAVLKDAQRHPVRGETMHVDLLRVDLDETIQSVVTVELRGGDEAPGVREGGVLEQVTREVTIEAKPGDIPETLVHDVSGMQMNDTVFLDALHTPPGVTVVDETENTTLASITPPNVDAEAEEEAEEVIEQETGVVGEGAGELEGSERDAGPGEVPATEGGG